MANAAGYEDKDGNIVILYMKAVKDESESNSKKSELENQKKSDYYNDTIKKLKKDTKIKVDEDAWDSIKVSKKEIYTSMKDADNDADDTSKNQMIVVTRQLSEEMIQVLMLM